MVLILGNKPEVCPTQNCQIKKKNSLNSKVIHEKQNKLSPLEHNQEES